MSVNKKIVDDLVANRVAFVTTVPCKQLAGVIDEVEAREEIHHIPSNKEDEGMGLCAGAFMGGKRPAIIMQNTAIGVTINTLATLIQFYRMPLPMLISYRGELGEPVACQVEMAVHTKALLAQLNIPTYHFPSGRGRERARRHSQAHLHVQQAGRHPDRCQFLEGVLIMIRSDILRDIAPIIRDHLVVCNIGLPSQELHMIDDQPTNFYMLGTMGLSSSIGLGLALAQKKKVIAIDGDGSVLTNFGTLPTIANNVADNFILLIIDNGSYGSTGDQPTYAGKKTSLAAVAKACGCENVVECQAEETGKAIQKALDGDEMTIIVAKCESGNIKVPVITMDPVVIRDRFMKSVQS